MASPLTFGAERAPHRGEQCSAKGPQNHAKAIIVSDPDNTALDSLTVLIHAACARRSRLRSQPTSRYHANVVLMVVSADFIALQD